MHYQGHGFEPDNMIDNLPLEAFKEKDTQLQASIYFIPTKFKEDPREVPPEQGFPDKSFNTK